MTITEKPTALTQEVRLATTLTGGVSLSIWMAGVSREINLLAQASQWRYVGGPIPDDGGLTGSAKASLTLYKRLLDLLDIVVEVDVLTGTSAGGINAAFLGLSRVKGYDLGRLRDVWLDLGALTDLIRDPTDKDTPSLLYGDERMYAALHEEIPKFKKGPFPPPPSPLPRTITYITTTLLNGETSRFTDSFGTLIQDVDRRGVFTFTEDDLAADGIAEVLALAARSSASFPLAFEPSFVPFKDGTPTNGRVPARPAMQKYANITRPHWAADGGLLDNQPIDLLLKRIFNSPAERPVRRVLLFIVPSSGPAPDAEAVPEDDADQPLGLLDGLLKDLSATTSQSIAADLRAIREHQDRMEARTDSRLRLAELAAPIDRLLTGSLLTDYRTREATKQTDALTAAMMRQLSTWPTEPAESLDSLPQQWRNELAVGGNAEKACRNGIMNAILENWPGELPADFAAFATYGRPAYELAMGCVISIIQAAYQLSECKDNHAASTEAITTLAKFVAAIPFAKDASTPKDLSVLIRDVCAESSVRQGPLEKAAGVVAAKYLDQFPLPDRAWETLARLLREHFTTLENLTDSVPSGPEPPKGSVRGREYAAAGQLRTYLAYLRSGAKSGVPDDTHIATRLFDLAVTQRAMLPADADVEQSLDLVQVSADTRSLVAPNFQTAQQKLTAMQFHHFGAFYKRSWRANDWMWGRLDGAGWLVHALLDPRRVRWIVHGHVKNPDWDATKTQPGARWLLQKLKTFGAPELPIQAASMPPGPDGSQEPLTEETLLAELRFIDDPLIPVPPSIPWTSMWLAKVWQQRILDDELNGLARTVVDPTSKTKPDWSPETTRTWATEVLDAEGDAKYALLNDDPVAGETLSSDSSSPLMAHTVTKATATTLSAARSIRQLPAALRPPLITLQTLALGGYRMVSLTNGVAKWSIRVGAALLLLGIVGAMQNATWFGLGGLTAAGIGSYLLVLGVWQSSSKPGTLGTKKSSRLRGWLRTLKVLWRRWWFARKLQKWRPLVPLLSVTFVGAVLALATPVVRRWLFGTDQHNNGLIGRHIYWLGSQWWHPLLAVGVLALIVTLAGTLIGNPEAEGRGPSPEPPHSG